MNKFIYQDIIDEFETYLDDNHQETIYLDTLLLSKYRDIDLDFIISDIIKQDIILIEAVLNYPETISLCSRLRTKHKIRQFKDMSLDSIDFCNIKKDWFTRLNSMQIIEINSCFKHKDIINEVSNAIMKYPITVKLTIQNHSIPFSKDPCEPLFHLLCDLNQDVKNEKFYSSYTKFYYTDPAQILDNMIKSITDQNTNNIAMLLPIVYILAKDHSFPLGTKTRLERLLRIIKNINKLLPKELDEKFELIQTISSLDPDDFKRKDS